MSEVLGSFLCVRGREERSCGHPHLETRNLRHSRGQRPLLQTFLLFLHYFLKKTTNRLSFFICSSPLFSLSLPVTSGSVYLFSCIVEFASITFYRPSSPSADIFVNILLFHSTEVWHLTSRNLRRCVHSNRSTLTERRH